MKHSNYQFARVCRTSGTDAKDLTEMESINEESNMSCVTLICLFHFFRISQTLLLAMTLKGGRLFHFKRMKRNYAVRSTYLNCASAPKLLIISKPIYANL